MRIIESWGTGIKRMIVSCREYGVREPEFLEIGDNFRVNLYRPSYERKVTKSSPKSSPKGSPKSSPKSLNGISHLSATQQRILEMFLDNPSVTQAAMAEELGITVRAVKRSVKELSENGIVERVGSARKGFWKVIGASFHK